MTYDLLYSEQSRKQLKKIDKQSQKRIISVLERSRIRPYSFIKKIVGSNYFRMRSGDYRIIVDIKENELIILVIEIGHRKNIYVDY